jgi:hypothetical protein
MIKGIKRILDKILLGFWIAAGVTLFQLCYAFGERAFRKLGGFIMTIQW